MAQFKLTVNNDVLNAIKTSTYYHVAFEANTHEKTIINSLVNGVLSVQTKEDVEYVLSLLDRHVLPNNQHDNQLVLELEHLYQLITQVNNMVMVFEDTEHAINSGYINYATSTLLKHSCASNKSFYLPLYMLYTDEKLEDIILNMNVYSISMIYDVINVYNLYNNMMKLSATQTTKLLEVINDMRIVADVDNVAKYVLALYDNTLTVMYDDNPPVKTTPVTNNIVNLLELIFDKVVYDNVNARLDELEKEEMEEYEEYSMTIKPNETNLYTLNVALKTLIGFNGLDINPDEVINITVTKMKV